MMGWYGNGAWWGIGMVSMGLFWMVVVVAAVWAVARLSARPSERPAASAESARQILDRRFAAGEIDETQYAQARRVLDGRSADDQHR